MLYCLIPAKAASTRLKRKNALPIAGKPMLTYPIRAAQESGLFGERIFVSTEDEAIREIAQQAGARVPYLRDPKLARDPYGVEDVTLDFLDRQGIQTGTIVILLPTAPLIAAEDIVAANVLFQENTWKYLMSVTETEHNAYRSVRVEQDVITPIFEKEIHKRSQELLPTYRINGAIAQFDIADFRKTKNYLSQPLGAYVMPRERSIDVDTRQDYELAKVVIENQLW